MENLSELKSDVKEIKVEIKEIAVTLARNTESLIHHSSRTAANEKRVQQVENWLLGFLASAVLGLFYHFIK